MHVCRDCGKGLDSPVRWPIPFHRAQFYRGPHVGAGAAAAGRPDPGALMIISSPGALPRSGATLGTQTGSRSMRMILSPTPVFTREIAERKEAKEARKQAALAAIQASLLVGGWLCPGCNEWNLSFRNLCYRCNGKRTAAGVLSRGIPDPTRDQQDRDESDSDDSAAIELRREQEEDLEETVKPFLRSTRTKRGSGGAQGGGSKGKFPKGRGTGRGAGAWLGVGVVAATCRGTGLVRGPAPLRLPPRPVGRAAPIRFAATRRNRSGYVAEPVLAAASYIYLGVDSPGTEPTGPHLHRQH